MLLKCKTENGIMAVAAIMGAAGIRKGRSIHGTVNQPNTLIQLDVTYLISINKDISAIIISCARKL